MTLTIELDLDTVKLNQLHEYLGHKIIYVESYCSETQTRTQRTDCSTRPLLDNSLWVKFGTYYPCPRAVFTRPCSSLI